MPGNRHSKDDYRRIRTAREAAKQIDKLMAELGDDDYEDDAAKAVKSVSFEEHMQRVRNAMYSAIGRALAPEVHAFVEYTYPDYAIINVEGVFYRADYTVDALGNVSITDPGTWPRVEREWMLAAVKSIHSRPHAVKKIGDYLLRGYGVVFGGQDLTGDTFTKATDLGQGRSFVGLPVFYDHALAGVKSQIGAVKAYEFADDGLIFEIEIDKAKRYADTVMALAESGALGQSTGAVAHLVYNEKGEMKRWIIGEVSLTPTPAEPRTTALPMTKTLPQAQAPQMPGDGMAQAGDDTYIII